MSVNFHISPVVVELIFFNMKVVLSRQDKTKSLFWGLKKTENTIVIHGLELVTVHPPPPTPLPSKCGTILFEGLLGMILVMLPEQKLGRNIGFYHFSKWPPWKSNLNHISSSKWHGIIILVSTPVFWGSKIRIKPLIKLFGYILRYWLIVARQIIVVSWSKIKSASLFNLVFSMTVLI